MPTILIGADVCPIEANLPLLKAGEAGALFNDLLPDFQQADLSLVNLECPLIRQRSPIPKTGPTFGEDPACINGLRNACIKLVCLANNHVLDHGPQGLQRTIQACRDAGIDTVGAGENLAAARRIVVRSAGGIRIGFLAVAEHEFSIAKENSWGANPLDVIDFVRNVREHRADFHYLVVLLHGADEFLPITPRIQDTCRFMIEMGANAVIVQHPHSLGGYEQYRGGHIVYGQGALLMDEAIYRKLKSFHEGFLVKLTVAGDARSQMELIPLVQSDPQPGARRMPAAQEAEFRKELARKSQAILDPTHVRQQWMSWCAEHKHGYLSALLGHNRVLRKLNGSGLVEKCLHGNGALLSARNVVQCETHREALQTIFEHM